MIAGVPPVSAQSYPTRPVRIITAPAGGGNDFAARLIAQNLAPALGQPVIVDNRQTGLTAPIAAEAAPDGHTLLLTANFMWIAPLMQKTTYDPVKSFAPVSLIVTSPHVLVVHPSLAAKSVKELIALARARPGELNYAAAEPGSANQLTGELFKSIAGVNIVAVTYKGAGPGVIALLGGQVQLMFVSPASVAAHIAAGKLRALGVSSARPSALFPELPPVSATLPGFEFGSTYAIFAPARTPVDIVRRLNREIVKVLSLADVKEKFFTVRIETVGSSAEELAATVRSDMIKWAKVIKDAGLGE
jgi:tripartite-type tricarboxylate transporter receptor subunit TctC